MVANPEQIRLAGMYGNYHQHKTALRVVLSNIDELSWKFKQLKSTFSSPPQLDYISTVGRPITIDVPSGLFEQEPPILPSSKGGRDVLDTCHMLAVTSNNRAVRKYIGELVQLLAELDKVEGDEPVRERRRKLVRNVVREANRVDRWVTALNPPPPRAVY